MQTPDTSLLDLVGMNAMKGRIRRDIPVSLQPDGYKLLESGFRSTTHPVGVVMPLGTMGHELPRFFGGAHDPHLPLLTREEVADLERRLFVTPKMKDPVAEGKSSMPGPLRVMYGIGNLLLDDAGELSVVYKLPTVN